MDDNHLPTDPDQHFDGMTADDWEQWLESHADEYRLIITDPDGTHTIEYDSYLEHVVFHAHGSMGYDYDGTRAVLEVISEQSDGLTIMEIPEEELPA